MLVCVAGATTLPAGAALGAPLAPTSLPAPLGAEVEPNDSPVEATFLPGDMRVRASLAVPGEVDYYRFEATAGTRVFASTITAAGMPTPADTVLALLGSDGTVLEEDDDGGSLARAASSIAGAQIPSDGTYFLEVGDAGDATATPAPYDIYLALRSGVAGEESEPNNEFTAANPLVNGEVRGVHEGLTGDKDWFALNLQAADTVFLSLDLDPERNGGSFDGQLGLGLAGDIKPPLPQSILTVDDAQPGEIPEAEPSEGLAVTVSTGGRYYGYVAVDEKKFDSGGPLATYDLAVTVFPAVELSCRTYSAPFASALIDGGTTTFPIQVDDPAQIARAAVRLDLHESVMADLDVFLRSPSGVQQPLFADRGATTSGGQQHLEAVFDDFAALPPVFPPMRPLGLQTDVPLAGFAGQEAQGTWSLVVNDDTPNGSAGNLAKAELIVCPEPAGTAPASRAAAPPPPNPPPVISDFKIAPSKFRAAKAGPTLLAKKPRGAGALVSYSATEAAQTNFVLSEANPGRVVSGKCRLETRANIARKPCTRWIKVISFVRHDVAGRNRFGFSGRVGARKLPPGEYELRATAYANSGLTSNPVAATFTILPPAPPRP